MRLFLSNLRQVLRAISFLRFDRAALRPTPTQIILVTGLDMVEFALLELWVTGPAAGVSVYGISAMFSAMLITLAALTGGAVLTRRSDLIGALLFGVPLTTAIGYGILLAVYVTVPQNDGWMVFSALAGFAAILLPTIIFIIRLYMNSGGKSLWRGMIASIVLFGLQFGAMATLPVEPIWEPDYGDTEDYADYTPPEVERIYYAQPSLLAAQTDGLRTGDPTRIEVFALIIGGTAYQNVFLHEAEAVGGILTRQYDADHRTITLVNSNEAPDRYPLANVPNIQAALGALATAMNPDQDILVLYMTSHGDHDLFSLSFYEFGTQDLQASALDQMLDDSSIRSSAVVLSACKSGSFIDDLADYNRLIITAASASRNSFGCADNRDWTWFGEAYFDQALRQTADFRAAFPIASALIEEWEGRDSQIPSDPQISTGAGFDLTMDTYLAQQAAPQTD